MATQTTIRMIDDLDGSEAVESIEFGIDGKLYEIDLSDANAAKLRDALAEFVASARRAGGAAKPAAKAKRSSGANTGEARAWLKANGYKVGDKGRIPADLLGLFESRTPAEAVKKDIEEGYVQPVETAEPTDAEVMAWWESKSFKPQTKVTGIMRSHYKKAHNAA